MSATHAVTPVLADMGIPMILIELPAMVCVLIPVIIIEALLVRCWVPLSYRGAFRGSALANLVSTVAGVPAAWLSMLVLQFAIGFPLFLAGEKLHWNMNSPVIVVLAFLMSAAWAGPSYGLPMAFIFAVSCAVLLVPTFFVSVWLERPICFKAWPAADRESVRRAVFKANLASYGLLFLLACGWIGYMLMSGAARPTG
jgi:hypothetical protein